MSDLETIGKTELLEGVGDLAAHEADKLIHVPGEDATVSIDANPANPSVQVEFTPHEDAPPIDFTNDTQGDLP